jgi:ABC-type glycerol-3-phosphate transport system substrate-binding protein
MRSNMREMKFLALAALALLLSAACSSSSEAARIVEADNISLRATLSYYQSLDPTMTAQAAIWTEQIATLQADLNQSREQVTRLTVQMNTGAAGAPVAMPTTDPNSFATIATPSQAISARQWQARRPPPQAHQLRHRQARRCKRPAA